jgi:hypothetical protein
MFEWLFLLFSPVLPVMPDATPKKDYIGVVAAEAGYASLVPTATPVKPKVPTKDCKTCKGLGKVPSGDGHEWTKCPDCDPNAIAAVERVYMYPPTPPTPKTIAPVPRTP